MAMGKPDFDPREVLERYVALVREPSATVVRSVTELAHPKENIRNVLQHCIRTETDPGAREFLHDAYISLSNFQEIGDADKEALAVLNEVGPIAAEGQAGAPDHARGSAPALADRPRHLRARGARAGAEVANGRMVRD